MLQTHSSTRIASRHGDWVLETSRDRAFGREVVPVEIELGLSEPLTAAVLGDVHFDPLYEIDYLEDVVARVNSLAPDLVLYTGDFLSKSADRLPDLLTVLRRARAAVTPA